MPKISVFFNLGWDPPTRTSRQNVAAAICQVDSQIVAWPAVKGRRAQGHRLRQKKAQVRHIADLILDLKMRDSDIVNLTNGGKNGITIRLHGFGHRRLDQRATRHSSKFLLDNDGNRYERGYEGKYRRNYFPNNVSSDAGSWSLDKVTFFGFCKRSGSWNDRLQMQRGTRSALQIYSKMDQGRRKMAGRKVGEERRFSKIQKRSSRCQIDLCSSFERTFKKLLLSTIGRIVLLRQLKKFICLFAAGIAGQLARWKKLNWEGHSSISQNFTVNTLRNADQILENKFPLTTWARNRLGFLIYIKYKRNKEQAQVL